MSSRESRAVGRGSARRRSSSKKRDPPNMIEATPLRIVLLGSSVSENSLVGNFILGRAAFDSEAPPDIVERVRGRLKDRHVIVINSPQLLQTSISAHQITRTVRECVNLSDPGPHVIVLVLSHEQRSAEDQERVEKVLLSFSESVYRHATVITTQEPTEASDILQKIIQKCANRHFRLQRSSSPEDLLQTFEEISKVNNRQHLVCAEVAECVKLNLVVCGSDGRLKSSVSEQILQQTEKELHDHQISLVELPALSQLSEEEVMRQALHCVSLCDPGVHVFLLIIPDAPLSIEDKAEMEEMRKIFSSNLSEHIMVLRIKEKLTSQMNTAPSSSAEMIASRCFVLESSSQIPDLLQDVENMVKMTDGRCYTTFMCLQDRLELERNKHRVEIEDLRGSVMKTTGVTHNDDLRIVLLGKTGVGKSASGNTILRRVAFKSTMKSSSVTRDCQKEITEFTKRQITVIDTPGLFDTGVDNVETRKEIVKCVSMAAPGPHVFLLVIQLGRITKEEKDAVQMIQEMFGEKSKMYTIVLFTRGDDLKGKTIQEFIEDDDFSKNLVQQFGKRHHVFNNNETENRKQVSDLLDKIDCMVAVNGGSFYTNEMFEKVEKNIIEEQDRIMKEKEEEIKRIEEELRAKYESEIEQIKKENERERQEMQNELIKREEEFKKREEEIKKDTDDNVRKEMQRKLEEQKKLIEEQNKRKKILEEEQQNFINYLIEKHEKEKLKLQKRIKRKTRKQAEHEYRENLEKELAKALDVAEKEVPHTTKRARYCNQFDPDDEGSGNVQHFVNWIMR
ncbi:GTPase IMAP family member 8-like isoform X2 [Puntigrus tetrazona]|uniref:GTPase IMAP family member 8-like isoform X2 n=2 Tax=Puntigrus tetrazona TaxID=1606681 RepID=UPI001C8A026B|nr:GTPase IMAP family member 8-like isoform X2 [Puntigrus tetrazona]